MKTGHKIARIQNITYSPETALDPKPMKLNTQKTHNFGPCKNNAIREFVGTLFLM